tara:strand:+ start:62387 stop:62869 length:483 start_codon:yes stop_codon:yes gene_type:complete
MKYLKISLGIFLILAASRFIPHPHNFTSLLALSFYVPALLGAKYIAVVMLCFFITDIIIGFHSVVFFTWGSVLLIGLLSRYFTNSFTSRISGALLGACLFFLVTNFGIWLLGTYGYSLNGLIMCFTLALPFFGYSLISTLVFSVLIESIYKIKIVNLALK